MNYVENPDLEWYKKISDNNKVPPRCPYTMLYTCPIYFQSTALLRSTGATQLDEKEEKKLIKFWEDSGLNPALLEEMPSVMPGGDGKFECLSSFCPEVVFLRFGYFASYISEFADGTDRTIRHLNLEKHNFKKDSWAWDWSGLRAKHYTDCRYYSILSVIPKDQKSDIKKIKLTDLQKEDYKNHKYKTHHMINIIGKDDDLRKENYIEIDENGIELGKHNFIIFVKLASELTRNNEGWINIESFVQETNLSFTGIYQLIGRLRENLMKINALDNNSVKELIENKKGGLYRISTHPDFITFNEEKLLIHKDPDIKKLAEELP